MKKIFITLTIAGIFLCTGMYAQTSSWRLGFQLGLTGNHSEFNRGMQEAHARFHHSEYGSGLLAVVAQKEICTKLHFETGIGVTSIGFVNSIAENYSLLTPEGHFKPLNSEICVLEIPASLIYKFNPDCRNRRWYIGAGIKLLSNSDNTDVTLPLETNNPSDIAKTSNNDMTQHITSKKFTVLTTHLLVGREKTLKSGRLFSYGLIFNFGYKNIAEAEVNYTLDNKSYTHVFSNKGSYCGLIFGYHLKPFKGKSPAVPQS